MGVKGFTLAEILITTVILGVIAGLAVPIYSSTIELSRSNEAKTSLYVILMGQKIYKLNSAGQVYNNLGSTNVASINSGLNVELLPQYYNTSWNVSAAGSGVGATFTASVCRGNPGNKCFTIDEAGTPGESGSY